MIYDKARDLAKAMAESEEYVSYKNAKEKAFANDTTKALQLNPDASAYLMAEYRLNTMLGDVYKILADGIDLDLGLSED